MWQPLQAGVVEGRLQSCQGPNNHTANVAACYRLVPAPMAAPLQRSPAKFTIGLQAMSISAASAAPVVRVADGAGRPLDDVVRWLPTARCSEVRGQCAKICPMSTDCFDSDCQQLGYASP